MMMIQTRHKRQSQDDFALFTANDPIAKEISWKTFHRRYPKYKTHNLVRSSANKLEFQESELARLLNLLIIFLGILFIVAIIGFNYQDGTLTYSKEIIFPVVIGILIIMRGMFQQYKYSIPIVFDAPSSLFYRGKPDANYDNRKKIKNAIPFNDIYAIQVISRFSYSNNHARYIYELNLVLKNRMRENLIGHSNKIAILENAQTLSQFLSVPLWNAVQ